METSLANRVRAIDGANLLLMVAAALLFLSFCYTEIVGPDMWWRVAAGRELVQPASRWLADGWVFSSQAGDWLSGEWLADIVFYGWVSLWGIESLVYWKWLLVVSSYAVLLYVLERESRSALTALLCSALAIAGAAPYLDVGPHLYTLLNFSLLLLLLLGRQASPWLVALLFVGWVNLHGGFIFGLLALPVLLWPWRAPNPARLRRTLLTVAVCLFACLLNPIGIKAFLVALSQFFGPDASLGTLAESFTAAGPGEVGSWFFSPLLWLPVIGLVYFLPGVRRQLDVPWEGLLLTALGLLITLFNPAWVPLLGMSLAVMIAPLAGLCLLQLRLESYRAALAGVFLAYGIVHLPPHPLKSGPGFHYLSAANGYPVEMLNFIEANDLRGKVYAPYSWGGYIHWRTAGGLKLFIDNRADAAYHGGVYQQYLSVLTSSPGWLALLESSGADYVLWPHEFGDGQGKLQQLLDTGRWQPLCDDSVSWLLARAPGWLTGRAHAMPETPWCDIAIAGPPFRDVPAVTEAGAVAAPQGGR